ncbi:MAG: molybdopterin-dependent oxidoreductase [Pseudomonadota bacterium]
MTATQIKTNCPRDCYDSCGILVEKRADKIRVLGDPDHPISRGKLCSKCAIAYNGVWTDANARLTTPLKRSGSKGSGEFRAVGWDEALEDIGIKLGAVIDEFGASSVLHTHYSGTLSLIGYLFPNRFFNAIGASEVDPDTICNAAGHVAWHLLFGNSVVGFDPRSSKDSQCILVWGANPSHSAPHAHEHWLGEFGGDVIVVDPIATETAQAASLHLAPRPGSDAALAFGLLHVMRAQGLLDLGYIETNTIGFEELTQTIDRATPERTFELTGIEARDVSTAAQIYAQGPSMLWCGQGLQRQPMGGNAMRSIGLLPSLTGNIGKPGTGFAYLNVSPVVAGIDLAWLGGAGLRETEGKMISHMSLAARLAGDEFRSLFVWNTNPAASAPEQLKLRAALEREDLYTVVVDCFMTDTARFADYVLPAASFLEYDDLTFGYFHWLIGAQTKVLEPPGEALPNAEIFRRLAKALGLRQDELFEPDQAMLAKMMSQMSAATGVQRSFAELQDLGAISLAEEPIVFYADGQFETPSGKIEIASAQAEEMGLPRLPQAHADASPAAGQFRLLSPASKWRLNDSYANDPHIASQSGEATVRINPEDGRQQGIADGERVTVSNDCGKIALTARLDPNVSKATALCYKGRWSSMEGEAKNANFLHQALAADMGESSSVHGTLVRISPA